MLLRKWTKSNRNDLARTHEILSKKLNAMINFTRNYLFRYICSFVSIHFSHFSQFCNSPFGRGAITLKTASLRGYRFESKQRIESAKHVLSLLNV